ncbi:hypothetical protein NYE27_01080 [Paenibacillus sp. FSL R10-2779]|uniref:hypothetical protein n=1 Tax=Paenibacillus sp. FSL R10-2779 TaxID=2975340 RepID=UPI0030F5944D
MELIDSLNQVKEDLQHSVDNLNKVKEDLYEQLHTTVAVGPYDEEEVYNSVDPILSDNSMDELEGIAERVGEVFNEIGGDLPERIRDLFDTDALEGIKEACDHGGTLRELSSFKPSLIEEEYLAGAHNEELDIAAQKASDAVAEARQDLAENAEDNAKTMLENIDELVSSLENMIDEL